MAMVKMLDDQTASPAAREVFDDIRKKRSTTAYLHASPVLLG